MPKLDALRGLSLLRILVGLLVFSHGLMKVLKGPVLAIGQQMAQHGFPRSFAYVVTAGELAGLLLAVGLYTRAAATAVGLTMLGIVVFVQLPLLGNLGSGKGMQLEYPMLLTACALLLAVAPGTHWSIDAVRQRR